MVDEERRVFALDIDLFDEVSPEGAPTGVTIHPTGDALFVLTGTNGIVKVALVTGVISPIIYADHGIISEGSFGHLSSITYSKFDGYLYATDSEEHKIWKISVTGSASVFAGSREGFVNEVGSHACFNTPTGIAVSSDDGSIFVADRSNYRIRKISVKGVVSTFAGSGEDSLTDGPAASAGFSWPTALALNPADGSLYVADDFGKVLRKVSRNGQVTTVAGNYEAPATKDGNIHIAAFEEIHSMVVVKQNLYIAERSAIRKLLLA